MLLNISLVVLKIYTRNFGCSSNQDDLAITIFQRQDDQ